MKIGLYQGGLKVFSRHNKNKNVGTEILCWGNRAAYLKFYHQIALIQFGLHDYICGLLRTELEKSSF